MKRRTNKGTITFLIMVILAMVLALSFTACGDSGNGNGNGNNGNGNNGNGNSGDISVLSNLSDARFDGVFTSSTRTWTFDGTNKASLKYSTSETVFECEIKLDGGHFHYRLWNNQFSEWNDQGSYSFSGNGNTLTIGSSNFTKSGSGENEGGNETDNGEPKSITITGLSAYNGSFVIISGASVPSGSLDFVGCESYNPVNGETKGVQITGGSVTVPLWVYDSPPPNPPVRETGSGTVGFNVFIFTTQVQTEYFGFTAARLFYPVSLTGSGVSREWSQGTTVQQ